MGTTGEMIGEWFDRGVRDKATHLIVVCDTFDHDDYPVYVAPGEDFWKKHEQFNGSNMQRVMEVYDLSKDKDSQLKEFRSFNYPPRPPLTECGSES